MPGGRDPGELEIDGASVLRGPLPQATLARQLLLANRFRAGPGYRVVRTGGADSWLLFATIAGAGRIRHRGGTLLTGPGDLLLSRAGTPHDYGTDPEVGSWQFCWAHFRICPGPPVCSLSRRPA
jgi:hypothetical protein